MSGDITAVSYYLQRKQLSKSPSSYSALKTRRKKTPPTFDEDRLLNYMLIEKKSKIITNEAMNQNSKLIPIYVWASLNIYYHVI